MNTGMKKRILYNWIFGALGLAMFFYSVNSLLAWIIFIITWLAVDSLQIKNLLPKQKLMNRLLINLLCIVITALMYFYAVTNWRLWTVFVIIWFGADYLATRYPKEKNGK